MFIANSREYKESEVEQLVEAGCASCIFDMKGLEDCKLAVKINGKPYIVRGTQVDAHEAGLCESTKNAVVAGRIAGHDLFIAKHVPLEQ